MPSNIRTPSAPAASRLPPRPTMVKRSLLSATPAAALPKRICTRSLPPSAGQGSTIPRGKAWVLPTSRPWYAGMADASGANRHWARARPLPSPSQALLNKEHLMPDIPKVTILLVEDDPGHARLIEKNLRRANITNDIVHVTDGQQAIDYLFSNGRPPSLLVLLDLNLPVLDGYQVLERMRSDERTKRIPVIILTTPEATRAVSR